MNEMTKEDLAEGCFCGHCTAACANRMFDPCCGACMVGSAYDPDGKHFARALEASRA